MARTKATVRRLPVRMHHLPGWLVNREYKTRKRMVYSFKIKGTLPEQKTVNITNNGKTIKTINVKQKCRYFNGKNRQIF